VTPSSTTVCQNSANVLTASGASTYTWAPAASLSNSTGAVVTATPSATTTYTITGSNGCVGTKTVTLTTTNCSVCPTCSTTLSGTITTNPASGGSYCINSNITISGNITFTNSEFKIAPNVTITVAPTSTLNITQSHLYACSNMWQGIVVPSTSKLYTSTNTLIEDAKVAISTSTTTQNQMATISLSTSVFNKNLVSLQVTSDNTINPPSGTTYPILVNKTIFTTRFISTSGSTMPNWPSLAVIGTFSNMPSLLQAPYLNSYNVTTCKSGSYPIHGIELNNVGVTTFSPTVFNEVYIGLEQPNIFDNHYYGIYANNSNFRVARSTFQYARRLTHSYPGDAIYASSTDNAIDNYRVQVYISSFYDVYTGLDMYHYINSIVANNSFYSTAATYTAGTAPVQTGQTGVSLYTNRYTQLTVDNNKLYNISNPIVFTADIGDYNDGSGGLNTGRYGGQVDITIITSDLICLDIRQLISL